MNAIASVQLGMTGIIAENQRYDGVTQNGYFTVIANDGSGALSSTEKTSVENAVEAVRPLCSTYSVHGPIPSVVTVSMTVTVGSNYAHADVAPLVQAAVNAYIASIETTESGATLPYTNIATQAWGVAGVTNVTNVLVNGATADLVIGYQQSFAPGTITVN
jgi:hypothetical protein